MVCLEPYQEHGRWIDITLLHSLHRKRRGQCNCSHACLDFRGTSPYCTVISEESFHKHKGRCQVSSCKLRQLTTTGIIISLAHEFVGVLPVVVWRCMAPFQSFLELNT